MGRCPRIRDERILAPLAAALAAAVTTPVFVGAQTGGEILRAAVLDVPSDIFGCGSGDSACALSYRIYHTLGAVEINAPASPMSGVPRFRPNLHAYATQETSSMNFPACAGHYDVPFFCAWDGVLNPQGSGHVGYYGTQSQLLRFAETGNSLKPGCVPGSGREACFEPLSTAASGQVVHGGVGPIGGLSPIPIPWPISKTDRELTLGWDVARGYTVTDGTSPGVAGYRLYVLPGVRHPSESALRGGAQLLTEIPSPTVTRITVPLSSPALAGAEVATFALRVVYVGGLESLYFSANSEPIRLKGEGEEDEEGQEDEEEVGGTTATEHGGTVRSGGSSPLPGSTSSTGRPAVASASETGETDADADGVRDRVDNCRGLVNPDQADEDEDGQGDACDPDSNGDGLPDDGRCSPPQEGEAAGPPVAGPSLRLQGDEGTRLTWCRDRTAPWAVLRGGLRAGSSFEYSHRCIAGGLVENSLEDEEVPAAGTGFYYLIAADSPCGLGVAGTASDGTPAPKGAPCLPVAIIRHREAGSPWDLRVVAGSDGVRLDLLFSPPEALTDLYAVSVDLLYDPEVLAPRGPARAGPLLSESAAPLRVELIGSPGRPGRLRLTVSRTGVSGGHSGRGGELASLSWTVVKPGRTRLRLEQPVALTSAFLPVPLPASKAEFVLTVKPPNPEAPAPRLARAPAP